MRPLRYGLEPEHAATSEPAEPATPAAPGELAPLAPLAPSAQPAPPAALPSPAPLVPLVPRVPGTAGVRGHELVAIDPDLTDPRVAAARYRTLLADLERARATLDERMQAGRADVVAHAQRHRDVAASIRRQVGETWDIHLARLLAQYGLEDLEQLRSRPADETPTSVRGSSVEDRGGTPGPGRPVARAGRHGERRGSRRDGKRLPARVEATRPVAAPIDPAHAPRDAHQLCLEAMGRAAELRSVTRGDTTVSVGVVTGMVCLLVGGLAAFARLFLDAGAFACLGLGALLGWLIVAAVAGSDRRGAIRAALVAAGSAGVAVLATMRQVPPDPAGIAASVVAVALAIRFGLGFGAGHGGGSHGKAQGGVQGRGRVW